MRWGCCCWAMAGALGICGTCGLGAAGICGAGDTVVAGKLAMPAVTGGLCIGDADGPPLLGLLGGIGGGRTVGVWGHNGVVGLEGTVGCFPLDTGGVGT